MATAKVFRSGNSQAVRIPKEFQLSSDEVDIRRRGDSLILKPKANSWTSLLDSLGKFSDDFMADGRRQPEVQKRDRPF
jgi:antitoxin VapB